MKMVSIPEEELERLKEKNRQQGRQINEMREVLERKNRDLDALAFVWCDGSCPRGVHRYSDLILTEEMVLAAERNTQRLRSWYDGVKWRMKHWPNMPGTMSEWHVKYTAASVARTDLASPEES